MVCLGSNLLINQAKAANGRNDKATIGSIKTAGNSSISSGQILSQVRSRTGQTLDATVAAVDAKRIAQLNGVEYCYYNTAIVHGQIQLTFVVVERELIRSIDFAGNRKYKSKTLLRQLGFKRGEYLDPVLVQTGLDSLAEFYRKKGFAFVKVTLDDGQLPYGNAIFTIDEGPRVKIKSVNFSGNKSIKTRSLKLGRKVKKRKFFFWPGYYTKAAVASEITRLQNIYYKRGFLNNNIEEKLEFNAEKNKVHITLVIDEGPVYTVQKLVLTGNRHFDESHLRKELKLEPDMVYSEQKAVADVKRLVKLYREIGFIDADVQYHLTFAAEAKVNIEFLITQGRRFRIGLIKITGNKETQDKVIRRVLDEYEFQPGQWYNADIARGDSTGTGYLEKLIRRSTYSQSARVVPAGQTPGQRDAVVNIIEGQTGSVMLGAGVASDSGLIGQLVFEQRNFDITDKPESFKEFITGQAFKGAGQHLRIALQPGTEVSEYSVSFSEPYFKDKPITLDIAGSSYERWRESYDEIRTKGYIGFEKRQKNKWRKSISFRAENVDVDDLDTDAPQDIIDVKGDNIFAGVKLGIGRDLTNDKFNPTAGYSFNVSYEQVAGDHTFGILSAVHRRYKTLYEDLAERKTVLATKLLGATAIGDAPPFERFYGGGSGYYGIRGFDYRGISTRGLQTNVSPAEHKDPIGSDWIFLANAEVTVPLYTENFALLFFIDSGAIDSGGYRVGAGVGIQILLPQWFGPVPMRFELAAPLMKDDDDDTQAFSFSIGRLF